MKVGVIGLGNIAKGTYLPILSKHKEITLVGAYSRNEVKTAEICAQYRMIAFKSVDELIEAVDAVFIHAATTSHFQIAQKVLQAGKPVYIDKPLASNLEDAQILVNLAREKQVALMVGFNRRFAPVYRVLKSKVYEPTFIHVEKNRPTPAFESASETLLDDFIHVVDTLVWLVDHHITLDKITYQLTECGGLQHINAQFKYRDIFLLASMHRNSGTDNEKVTIIDEGKYLETKDMLFLEKQTMDEIERTPIDLRIDAATRRGFVGAIDEFIAAVKEERMPLYFGEESLQSQMLIEEIVEELKKK